MLQHHLMQRDPRDDLEDDRIDAPAGLFVSRRGNWFHDGNRIRHHGLTGLLDRSVARADDGALIVTTGRDVLPITCEDAPIFVRSLDVERRVVVLSTGEEAMPGVIAGGDDRRWRSPCRGTTMWALWTRAATQLAEPHLVEVGDDVMLLGSRLVPLVADWSRVPTLSEISLST